MTSPAICVFEGDTWSPDSCEFYSLSDHKIKNFKKYHFTRPTEWTHDMQRYHMISEWAMACVVGCSLVAIEGYSMGSKGRATYNIGENGGILKWKLWAVGQKTLLVPPTTVKKYATGRGTAKKDQMVEAFRTETGFDLKAKIQPNRLLGSPTTDLVDAYYICKYAASRL